MNLEDTPELTTVEDGEYKVRCEDASFHESKAGNKSVRLVLTVPEVPEAETIYEYLTIPNPEKHDERTIIRMKNAIKDACEAFGVPFDARGFDIEHFEGAQAWAVLGEQESEEYGTQNTVRRFVTEQ